MTKETYYCDKHNIKKYKTVNDSWRCAECVDELIDKEKKELVKLTKKTKKEEQ